MGAAEKQADEIVNNSAVLQDDDDLHFVMAANGRYVFRFVLFCRTDGGPAAGVRVALNGPAGVVSIWAAVSFSDAFGVGPTGGGGWITAYESAETKAFAGGEGVTCWIEGSVENGATAGEIVLRWAQDIAAANNTRMRRGSHMEWQPICSQDRVGI